MKREMLSGRSYDELWRFFLLTFAFSWFFFVTAAIVSLGTFGSKASPTVLIILGAFGPSFAAFALLLRLHSRRSVTELVKRGFDVRLPPPIYLAVSLIPLAIGGIASFFTGGTAPQFSPELPIVFIVIFFLGGSFGEEFGWRGFALPRLFVLITTFNASIVLGSIWATWHLPLFWIEGTTQFTTPFVLYIPYILSLSVQYTWVYLRTEGNLFCCLLLHTFTNMTVMIFPLAEGSNTERFLIEVILCLLVSLIILSIDRRTFFSKFIIALPPTT